jgi:hypothetical protein
MLHNPNCQVLFYSEVSLNFELGWARLELASAWVAGLAVKVLYSIRRIIKKMEGKKIAIVVGSRRWAFSS